MDHHGYTKMLLLTSVILFSFKFVLPVSIPSSHSLYSALHHFETLHKVNDIHHRVVRDNMPHPRHNLRQIQFRTLGRHFQLLLSPHTRPFHPHAESHYAGNTHSKRPINVYQFFHGHVFGAESSHVIAHVTDDGVITAVITIGDNSYYLEPSDRHFSESHDFHMITYRGSDLKFNMTGDPNKHFCGVTGSHDYHDDPYDDKDQVYFSKLKSTGHTPSNPTLRGRLKRQASSVIEASTVCPVNLVATTSFHQQFGGSDEGHTINFLLVVMLQIDDAIFRRVDWSIPGVSGSASPGVRGFQIANVTVLTTTENSPAYNTDQRQSSENLLGDFSRADWSDYCLAHLFTARPFTDSSRLGVAYTAFFNSLRAGGICSRRTTYQDRPFSGNVGVSTYRASDRFLVLAEAIVVTGHEFGHSWGSSHDPDTAECSPPFNDRGKYIMYSIAQDGQAPNNMMFSDCSRRAVSQVLNTHEDECFVEPTDSMCGDFIIDDGEECDPGPSAILRGGDLCCDDDCTFKTSSNNGDRYNCSDSNHDCCIRCRPSAVGEVCHQEEEGNINCYGNRTCNGGITCPDELVFVKEGSSCAVMGQCQVISDESSKTECVRFCETQNLTTCNCIGDNECALCCKQSVNSSCIPFDNPFTFLPDGSFCEGGTCDGQGVCNPAVLDLSTFLFELLTDFSTAAFIMFLRENIVGSVLIISLVVWIPASVLVHIFDIFWEQRREKIKDKKKKKRRGKKHWEHNERTPLIQSEGGDNGGGDIQIDSPQRKLPEFIAGRSPEHHAVTTHISRQTLV